MPHHCVLCGNSGVVMHMFPNPNKFPERFQAWLNLLRGKLDTLSSHDIYQKKRICDIHFVNEHRNRFKRLNALAVPTLNLPTPGITVDVTVASHPTTSTNLATTTSNILDLPITFSHVADDKNCNKSSAVTLLEHNYSVISRRSVARGTVNKDDKNCNKSSAATLLEHNYSVISRRSVARGTVNKDAAFGTHKYAPIKSLHTKIRYLRSEICRLRQRGQSFKVRLANAQKLSDNNAFLRVTKHMTKPAQLFVQMQLQSKKKPKGRRFSIEEKILCASLFKKSPKCYRLLYKYFTLPSSKTMKHLLSKIKIKPGINKLIFEKIHGVVKDMEACDRLCTLIFDEMSLTPQINFNSQKDKLEGFASNKENAFADHALVFMVKGIKRNFKQPVAYYFTNSLCKISLKNILKSVVQNVLEAGLIIVSTVCDQSPVNVGAISELISDTRGTYLRRGKEWKHDMFRVSKTNIIPLYDTPHLIKGIRNNLLNKDMIYTSNGETKTIKWDYYQMVYAADKSYQELRLLSKLTEEHVNPEKINKMRVKSATQLFSHSVAVVTEHLTARGDLPVDCRQLIDFTILLDNLFDTLNVSTLTIPNGKIFKGPVKRNSPHHQLWTKAKTVLKTVRYIKKVKVGDKIRLIEIIVPSITNLIKTIEGMENIWKLLNAKYGLDVLLTRNLNQDPVENFFGNIRSYGARNIAPNTVSFEGAYKALLINNYNSPHSNRANCEEDSNKCLQTLDFFLKDKTGAIETPDDPKENTEYNFNFEICLDYSNISDAGQGNYVCGWVVMKCLKNIVKKCQQCKSDLLVPAGSEVNNNQFIKAKEYLNKKWLCYPSEEIVKYFKEIQHIATSILKRNVPKSCLKQTIQTFLDVLADCPFRCPNHKDQVNKYFNNLTLNVIIFSWCRSINRILAGKIQFDGEDEVKVAALKYYHKYKHYKNRK